MPHKGDYGFRDEALKGNATGPRSGRIARFGALEKMLKRKKELKDAQAGSSGGKIHKRSAPPGETQDDLESIIDPSRKRKKIAEIRGR